MQSCLTLLIHVPRLQLRNLHTSCVQCRRSCLLIHVLFSLPHRKAGSLYTCHNFTDVQDSCVKRPGPRLQSKCFVFRWNQVQWRVSSHSFYIQILLTGFYNLNKVNWENVILDQVVQTIFSSVVKCSFLKIARPDFTRTFQWEIE